MSGAWLGYFAFGLQARVGFGAFPVTKELRDLRLDCIAVKVAYQGELAVAGAVIAAVKLFDLFKLGCFERCNGLVQTAGSADVTLLVNVQCQRHGLRAHGIGFAALAFKASSALLNQQFKFFFSQDGLAQNVSNQIEYFGQVFSQ